MDQILCDGSQEERIRILKQLARDPDSRAEQLMPLQERFRMLLRDTDTAILAQCCWTIGMIGYRLPVVVAEVIPELHSLLTHTDSLVRTRAIWALGRIGRDDSSLVERCLPQIMDAAVDPDREVRMTMIWACENLARSRPDGFADSLPVFMRLLDDPDVTRVRREAPEFFRVLGKLRPDLAANALTALQKLQHDPDTIVRFHAAGAERVILDSLAEDHNQ
jgi:hypothetical protein